MMRFVCAAVMIVSLAAAAGAQTLPQQPPRQMPPRAPNADMQTDPASQPKRETFQDKAARCMHYGSSVGAGPGQIGQYTRECVNTR
jgi:hypothetical protein